MGAALSSDLHGAAVERLLAHPRQHFGCYPTPLEALPRVQQSLGAHAPQLLIKRDDYTGFALGGNKVRKLEYELFPERIENVDVLITAGGVNSNHARVTAAAAARLGKECILVLNGEPTDPPRGNAMLQRLFGARIVGVSSRAERTAMLGQIEDETRREGRRPLVIPLGASTPLGALGYARAALELARQFEVPKRGRTWIIASASSAGTLAGLLLGLSLAGLEHVQLLGVSPDDPAADIRATARTVASAAARLLGLEAHWPEARPLVADAYVGGGYGIPTAESRHAIELFARREGIVLDPVYSAKAAAGLLDWIAQRRMAAEDTVVFWHTGGHPALFT